MFHSCVTHKFDILPHDGQYIVVVDEMPDSSQYLERLDVEAGDDEFWLSLN